MGFKKVLKTELNPDHLTVVFAFRPIDRRGFRMVIEEDSDHDFSILNSVVSVIVFRTV